MTVAGSWIFILLIGGICLTIAGIAFLCTETVYDGIKTILGTICITFGLIAAGSGLVVWTISHKIEADILHKKICEIQTIEQILTEGKLPSESTPAYEARLADVKKIYEREASRASSKDWDAYKRLYIDGVEEEEKKE